MRRFIVVVVLLLLTACVGRPDPAPAVLRDTAPPWDAPRDAIAYIQAAGLPELGLGADSDPWITAMTLTVGGKAVEIPAFIGIDRLRAVQAPVHTHDTTGDVWLEGDGNRDMTLGDFFDLWGVRFGDGCLGASCDITVVADGAEQTGDLRELGLRGVKELSITAR